jgi:hypothetical protein
MAREEVLHIFQDYTLAIWPMQVVVYLLGGPIVRGNRSFVPQQSTA